MLGSTGFIGGALYQRLLEKGHLARSLPTSSTGLCLDRNCDWLPAVLDGVEVVYLCAGRTGGVGRMVSDPFSFIYPNIRIHMNVFQACALAKVRRVVTIQSTTGYPDSSEAMNEEQYTDGDLHPAYFVPGNAHRFIYRLSKMFKELEVVFFRPSNVYGPRNSFDKQNSHVIEATVRKVFESQDPFVIWGSGEEVRDAVYIDDLAELMTYGADCEPGAYNAASGEEMSVNQIVSVLLEHASFYPEVKHDLSKPTSIPARRVDITKAKAFGWSPKVSMREGLKRTYDWYVSESL